MRSKVQQKLLSALEPCLRLIARTMLRSGIGYRETAEILKRAFVSEAIDDKNFRGRSTNVSRVSIKTGISRKEVARLRSELKSEQAHVDLINSSIVDVGHAARVLQLWHSDSRFLDDRGRPTDLPVLGEGVTFAALVKAAGRDVPPGAVRAELVDAGALVETETGLLRAVSRHFVPADVGEDLILGLTHFVMPVLAGVERNTDGTRRPPFLQRLSYSDALSPSALEQFRALSRERAIEFVQSVDDWLLANESDPAVRPTARRRVGLGVFYYEENLPTDSS
jgi:hypothetical protein